MGIDLHQLRLLCELPRGALLCLGYPDLLVSEGDLRALGATRLVEVSDPRIGAWHGWKEPLFDTDPVLRDLGFEPVYIDIAPARGRERKVDLNEPLPEDLWSRFDTVFDGGTLEHCFNIGQGFRNVALALKPDGYAVHVNPLSQVNHGFYCISPGLYFDFYREVRHLVVWKAGSERCVARMGRPEQRHTPPPDASNVAVCRYPVEGWPTQKKYAVQAALWEQSACSR